MPFKIVFVGNEASGKTSLIAKAPKPDQTPNPDPTIGAAFVTFKHKTLVDDKNSSPPSSPDEIKLEVWDTAGNGFKNLSFMYMDNKPDALCLVVDLYKWGTLNDSDPALKADSEHLIKCVRFLRENSKNNNLPIYLIGTKQDLVIAEEQGNPGIMSTAIQRLIDFANRKIKLSDGTETLLASHIIITSAIAVNSANTHTCNNLTSKILTPLAIFQQVYQDLRKANPVENNDNLPTEEAKDLVIEPFPSITNPRGPSVVSRFVGAIVGALTGAFFGFIIHNPGTCLLAAFRAPDWHEWGAANLLRAYLFAPFINPIANILYGFKDGGTYGATHGIYKVRDIPGEMTKPFKARTIIAGSLLSLFISAAVIAAVISLIHISLPVLLGVAGAGALVATVSYEGFDFFKTDSELRAKIKNNAATTTHPATAASDSTLHTRTKLRVVPGVPKDSMMLVNAQANTGNSGTLRSWFQASPPQPNDSSHTNSGASPIYQII